MRWFVEISGLGKKPGKFTTLCVEATQWQPALQRARSLRGDDGPLSNFSIELLDDGYRAIDPSSRLKYVVRRAPDDAELSTGGSATGLSEPPPSGRAASKASASTPPPAAASNPPPAAASKPPPAAAKASTSTPPVAPTAVKVQERAATVPAGSAVPTTKPSEGDLRPRPRSEPPPPRPAALVEAKPLIAIPLDKPPPPPVAPGLPRFTVQSQRDEDPTGRSPLHYREAVYVVPASTTVEDAERLLRDRLSDVRRSFPGAATGRLVNLAAFDHAFDGRPQRPPLVTLTWKDWRGEEPELRAPSRNGAGETPTPLASASAGPRTETPKTVEAPQRSPSTPAPKAEVPPVIDVVEPPAPAHPAPLPTPPPPPPSTTRGEVSRSVPAPKSSSPTISISEPSPGSIERIIALPEPGDFDAGDETTEPSKPPVEVEEAAAALEAQPPAPASLPGPRTIVDAPRIDVFVDEPQPSFPTPSIVPPTPSYVPPVPKQPAATQPPPPPVPATKRKKQLSADDLISELFEAMSDLHFLGDALAGADYVLAVALEKIPSEVGLVSLFDINKREFVVVRQRGGPQSVLGFRQPEKAKVALSAMRSKAAVRIDGEEADRVADDRLRAVGVDVRGLMCAPIALGGRYLGVIELVNSADGAFREADGNALTYVGQQYGEFVAERGVVIDEGHILDSAKAAVEAQSAKAQPASRRR